MDIILSGLRGKRGRQFPAFNKVCLKMVGRTNINQTRHGKKEKREEES